MDLRLSAEDLDGMMRLIERCEPAPNARELSRSIVTGLAEELGFERSWMVVSPDGILEYTCTGTGAVTGIDEFERGAEFLVASSESEPIFSIEARQHLWTHGVNTVDEVRRDLGIELSPQMKELCACLNIATWLTVWLDTGLESDGYLVVVSERPGGLGDREVEIFRRLRKHMINHLRRTVLQPSSDVVLESLSPRESEVTKLVADGHTNPEISELLGVSVPTVKKHVKSALRKSGLPNRTALAVTVRQAGALS